MNKFSLETGRQSQKKKTRQKILESTQKLLSKGEEFSLIDVAEHSNTSRATVYRYFSNIDILCAEAGLDINVKSSEALMDECKHLSLTNQILFIQDYFNQLSIDNEPAFRKYLSIYLKEDFSREKKSIRGARRTSALKLILKPYKKILGKDYQNLIASTTALMGIEPIITTKDVCFLNNEEAKTSLRFGLKSILGNYDLKKLE